MILSATPGEGPPSRERNLKGWKLLDDFIDGIDDFSSGQGAVGGGSDDVKCTF